MSFQKKSKKILGKEKQIKLRLEKNETLVSINKNSIINKSVLSSTSTSSQNNNKFQKNDIISPTKSSADLPEQFNGYSSSPILFKNNNSISKKNIRKEEILKEIKKYCILDKKSNNSIKTKKNYEHFAKEFLKKCKKSLDEKQFELIISKLTSIVDDQYKDRIFIDSIIDDLFRIIQKDHELKIYFCAFLSSEKSLNYNMFIENLQYEKTNEFIQTLESFISNKCTMKRLLQSIISNCSSNLPIINENNVLKQCQHYEQQQIINDIKSKVKSSTKNNPLINYELDYLFDQQLTNIKPQFEKVSLLKDNDDSVNQYIQKTNITNFESYEYVDLSKDSSLIDNGTKKCICDCHQSFNNDNNNDNFLQTILNHCILCSLKLIKGRLCIKCEGKKAIPLNYKLTNNSNIVFKT